jgi:lipopolysaccharide/colanic/teichoic acid biosynthesis glycosyltransferase
LFGLRAVREVGGMPFVPLRIQTLEPSRAQFKRFMEVVGLVAVSPLLLVAVGAAALYVRIVAGAPVLYRQARIGRGGVTFEMLKLRTMVVGAERRDEEVVAAQEDPRVVRGCGWLRRMRVDELPQAWNVVRGEMSIVGPRPERPELSRRFRDEIVGYERRWEIPPGITGLAQVRGRYHTDPEYKLGYDLQYLVNWSPMLDAQILLQTLWVALTGRG